MTTKGLAKEYRSALDDFMTSGGEAARRNGYQLGRRALDQQLGMLDVLAAHQQALAALLRRPGLSAPARNKIVKRAGEFLAECLSPFEMAQRGVQETIATLNSLNARLEGEVERRTRDLRESEERYRLLIRMSPDAITVTDLQGHIELCNPQSALLHGFASPEEAIGANAGDFVALEDAAMMQKVAHEVLDTGAIREMEYSLRRKDGTRVPVDVRVTLLRDAEGKPQAFVGINRDITARKQARQALEAQARRQAAVLDLGLHALSDVGLGLLMGEAVRLVADTLAVEVVELLELLPGGDRLILRDGVGLRKGLVGSLSLGAGEASQAGFTLLAREPVVVEDLAHETRFTPPAFLIEHGVASGMTVVIHGKDAPYGVLGAHTLHSRIFTADESTFLQLIANVLAMAIDNRRLLESEAARREAAENENEMRLKALAIVSHELRTPLTSIKGFATTLLADDVVWDADSQRDFIQTIDDEANKLIELIEQLLDLSKMDIGVFEYAPTEQLPSKLITPAKGQLQAITENHELVIDVSDELPPVLADARRVAQVLTNLVENAAKYSPPGTIINVSAAVRGDALEISVSDQGVGIAPQDKDKVFEPFYRAAGKVALKTRGAGLGLTICRRLVEAQGGRIWVKETPGRGATIAFTLPLAPVAERQGGIP